ncbi:MAG: porin [Gammaproteobacteria bacterium]|nr:porin [Gammaproteobacteria bacterium]
MGFIQPTYMTVDGTQLPVGAFAGQDPQFNVHQPDLSSESTFQLQRARFGVRGLGFPLDPKINYFLLAEFGNNGITNPGGGDGSARITDASVTFNHINGAKVRVGQMKIPMSEEVYQGIFTFNYINFTNMANQQMIERPFQTDGNTACNITTSSSQYLGFCNGNADIQFRTGAQAVRDIGIQVFDTFTVNDWEHSYALLYGNGGISQHDRDDNKDTTVYLSTEKVFAGEGPRRQGMKFYAWSTQGKRTIYDSAALNAGGSLTAAEREYERKLAGIGTTILTGKHRFWAEYNVFDGMIFNGSTGGAVPGAVNNAGTEVSQFLLSTKGESDGYYLDYGYKVTPQVELDLRYDIYNRVTNLAAAAERTYETTTLGLQYFFNKKTRFTFNHELRTLEAPGQASTAGANKIGAAMDDRTSMQVFMAF